MAVTLSSANIWSLWSGHGGQGAARFFAAAVPVACWAPLFVAPLVPGTAVDDPPAAANNGSDGNLACLDRGRIGVRQTIEGYAVVADG